MSKTVKRCLIFVGILLVAYLIGFYLITIHNAYNGFVYFTAKSAVKNWSKEKSEEVLFEFEDENFYICFDNNENIKSARKDTVFWVKNQFNGFPQGTNMIRSTTINDILYIYGVTEKENVKEVKIVDSYLNNIDASFNGKQVDTLYSSDALCFCLKVPVKEFIVSPYSLAFIDSNNKIVSEIPVTQDSELDLLLEPVLKHVNQLPDQQTVNQQMSDINYSLTVRKGQLEKFYIAFDKKNCYLQEYSQTIKVEFADDYALIIDQNTITTRYPDEIDTDFYTRTYKMEYTEDLLNLKYYAIEQNEKDVK